jgi:hypothetical protein
MLCAFIPQFDDARKEGVFVGIDAGVGLSVLTRVASGVSRRRVRILLRQLGCLAIRYNITSLASACLLARIIHLRLSVMRITLLRRCTNLHKFDVLI